MKIEIDKEDYKNLIETQEEFIKTVKKLENIIIENIKLKDKFQAKEQDCENYKQALDEIQGYINTQLDEFGNDVYCMDKSAINRIQNIINKAKEQ